MLSEADLKRSEAAVILNWLEREDYLVVLDEKGKLLSSVQLADFLQLRGNESVKNIVFLIGGAYGIDEQVFKRAQMKWSLSALTYPHALVRVVLAEQLYRAQSILDGHPYHRA